VRIALLSDIHGNSLALDGVLADIEARGGVDGYWILGDIVALGPDPVGVLTRIRDLPNVTCIRGNTDRYVVTGDRPRPTLDEAAAEPSLLTSLVGVAGTFAWTQGMVTASGWLAWLEGLPTELRTTLPDGTSFLGVHAAPGRDDGEGIEPTSTADEIATLLSGCDATLICVGHVHQPSQHRVNGQHVVNLGAVSLAVGEDRSSSYFLLEASESGYQLMGCRVPYDRAAVIDQLERVRHPGRAYLVRNLSAGE
jgi:predicted phosphodiesterase